MKVTGFLWLPEIEDKLISKHRVTPAETEEAVLNARSARRVQRGNVHGEDVFLALGRTHEGRYLAVFFVLKRNGQSLVISARDMTTAERRQYGKTLHQA